MHNYIYGQWLQGACIGAVPSELQDKVTGVPLQTRVLGQCLLLTDVGGMWILGSGNMWIDNIYLRATRTSRTPPLRTLLSTGPFENGITRPNVYLTGIQLQGDNVFETGEGSERKVLSLRGIDVDNPTYMSGMNNSRHRMFAGPDQHLLPVPIIVPVSF